MKFGRWALLSLLALSLTATASLGQQQPPDDSKEKRAASELFSMDLEALLNIKVTTASKFTQKLSDAPSVMSVVSRDELRRFGGITVLEVLERVAGLTGSSAFFADRGLIAVRGDQTRTNAGHTLILINGRPVRENLEGGVSSDILKSFPVNLLV